MQTLKKSAPSGSIAPSARSPSVLGSEPPKPTNKFRPKVVARKTKEQRDAIEKLEQDRYNERLKEAAAIQRGRGGQRGQRGSFRGRGGTAGMAHGPLGGAKRGRGGAASAMGRGRIRSAISGGNNVNVDDDSDEGDSSLLISIDQMNLYSDDEEMDIKGKMPIRRRGGDRGLRPVRVERHEHEERVISVNMESSTSKTTELAEDAAEDQAAESSVAPPAKPAVEEPRVKPEPVDDADTPMTDIAPIQVDDDGFLPAQSVRVRRKVSDPKSVENSAEEPIVVERHTRKPKARDPRDLLRTKEEIDEYERHLQDLDHVRDLLYYEVPPPEDPKPAAEPTAEPSTESATAPAPETATGEDAAEEQEDGEKEEKPLNEKLLGQLFLMQFPPMTPNLVVPGSTESGPGPEAAADQAANAGNGVKTEGNDDEVQAAEAAEPSNEPSKVITATTDWSLPAGRAGKLNVHKSGRVTMDWGGISFELDRAAAVDFVQEALIVSAPEASGADAPPEESVRHAWSMGQLSGKFTVMPNWDQML